SGGSTLLFVDLSQGRRPSGVYQAGESGALLGGTLVARRALGLVLIGVAYFLVARLGLSVASLHPSASPVWPPSGWALAACLLWGNWVWPAIAAGAFFANATTFGSMATSSAIAIGNTLEAVVTASLVDKWCARTAPFETPSRVAAFAALTLAPGTI